LCELFYPLPVIEYGNLAHCQLKYNSLCVPPAPAHRGHVISRLKKGVFPTQSEKSGHGMAKSPSRDRSSSGGRGHSTSTRRASAGRGEPFRKSDATAAKFEGSCDESKGHTFDCSSANQADQCVHAIKALGKCCGSAHKFGGDTRSCIANECKTTVPMPLPPHRAAGCDPAKATPEESMQDMIFKGEVDAYVKRKTLLEDNLQKLYALILGQCAKSLESRLKQQNNWETISHAQDALGLLRMIKTINYKFEEQKFFPLALQQAKAGMCALRQGNQSCDDCLECFCNTLDVIHACNGVICDNALVTHFA